MTDEREYKTTLEQRERVREYYQKNKVSIGLRMWADRNRGKSIEEIAGIIKKPRTQKKLTKRQRERLEKIPTFSIEHKKVIVSFD